MCSPIDDGRGLGPAPDERLVADGSPRVIPADEDELRLPASTVVTSETSSQSSSPRSSSSSEVLLNKEIVPKEYGLGGNFVTRFLRRLWYRPKGLSGEEKARYYEVTRHISDLNRREDIEIIRLSVRAMQELGNQKIVDYNRSMIELREKVHQRVDKYDEIKMLSGDKLIEIGHFYRLVKQASQIVENQFIPYSATHATTEDTLHEVFWRGRDAHSSVRPLESIGVETLECLENNLYPLSVQEIENAVNEEIPRMRQLILGFGISKRITPEYPVVFSDLLQTVDLENFQMMIEEITDHIHLTLTLSHKVSKNDVEKALVKKALELINDDLTSFSLGIEELEEKIERSKKAEEHLRTQISRNNTQEGIYNEYIPLLETYRNSLVKRQELLSRHEVLLGILKKEEKCIQLSQKIENLELQVRGCSTPSQIEKKALLENAEKALALSNRIIELHLQRRELLRGLKTGVRLNIAIEEDDEKTSEASSDSIRIEISKLESELEENETAIRKNYEKLKKDISDETVQLNLFIFPEKPSERLETPLDILVKEANQQIKRITAETEDLKNQSKKVQRSLEVKQRDIREEQRLLAHKQEETDRIERLYSDYQQSMRKNILMLQKKMHHY